MSFALFVAGSLVVIGGVAWGLIKLGVPPSWVMIVSIILLGIGILIGVARTRSRSLPKDPSD